VSAARVPLDLGCALLVLVAWSAPESTDGAPALPERESLHEAACRCLGRYRAAYSAVEHRDLIGRYHRWRDAYRSVSVDLAHERSPDAVLAADLLATLDEALCEADAAHAARRARGKAVSRDGLARVAELRAAHDRLADYDAALHRAMGHERASRQAVYFGDQLHQRVAG
jgi:hypothetical protein